MNKKINPYDINSPYWKDIPIYDEIPTGWKIETEARNKPRGYVWISNGKSFFSKERKSGLYKLPTNI